jgi:hypothetical protein
LIRLFSAAPAFPAWRSIRILTLARALRRASFSVRSKQLAHQPPFWASARSRREGVDLLAVVPNSINHLSGERTLYR